MKYYRSFLFEQDVFRGQKLIICSLKSHTCVENSTIENMRILYDDISVSSKCSRRYMIIEKFMCFRNAFLKHFA